jgi:hypothetical protein
VVESDQTAVSDKAKGASQNYSSELGTSATNALEVLGDA